MVHRWKGQSAPIWGAVPPPPRVRKYERLKIVSRTPTTLIILSDQVEETYTHYVDSRTVFCTGPLEGCWVDHKLHGGPRYGAWLCVELPGITRPYLLRLTAVAVSVDARIREEAGRLRGRYLQVWRVHGHEKSEMAVRVLDERVDGDAISPCPDIRFNVERMLSADDRPKNPAHGKWKGKIATPTPEEVRAIEELRRRQSARHNDGQRQAGES